MQTSLFEREIAQHDRIRPLRPRQHWGIEATRDAIREGHRHIGFQAPPGFGKTRFAAEICASALRKGLRPLFTCPAISLIDQTLESFENEGIHDIGVMQANHPRTNPHACLQIASVQTLLRRAALKPGIVIVDEFHERFEGLDALLADLWKDIIVIGLSATPWSRGLGLHYSKLIIGATFRDMMADGLAREYTIYGPERDVERGDLPVVKGEFEEKAAGRRMSEPTIIGDVLKEWKEKSTGEKTFAFCHNRDHARAQMEAFQDAGIPFGYIDANTPPGNRKNPEKDTRAYIFKQMAYGEIAGIASVGCLIRGVDEIVYNILDLALTKSEIRHVQKWGRMRTADPNATYIGLDHAGNNAALGLFTDIFHDHLDTRKPGERGEAYKDDYKPAKPRKCQKCHNLIPAGARKCAVCQGRVPLNSGVKVVDGRLVEIGSGPKVNMKERQEWYSGLLYIARKGNLKDGWAAYRYKEKFGDWPKNLKVRGRQPSDEVKEFVKKQRTEYLGSRPPVAASSQMGGTV